MIVDHLVLHHTYAGNSAFDVSQNHHHGRLEHVGVSADPPTSPAARTASACATSPTLAKMRAVRTAVRFRWEPNGHRRFNLIEGYLSFALVIDGDNSLHGTIHQRGGGWPGAKSAAGVVQPGVWHEAVFVHDGFSACRVELDGTTVAESFDVPGPMSGVEAPYGIAIGHWPDPGDQYSFVGEMSDVHVWIDRPEAIRDVVDDCCIDGEVIDEAFFDVRAGDFDRSAYDHGPGDAGPRRQDVRGDRRGWAHQRAEAWDLARRFALGLTTGDRTGFVESIARATQLTAQRIPEPTLLADVATLVDTLRPTVIGPLVDEMALRARRSPSRRSSSRTSTCRGGSTRSASGGVARPIRRASARTASPPTTASTRPPTSPTARRRRPGAPRPTTTTTSRHRSRREVHHRDPARGEGDRGAGPPVLAGAAVPRGGAVLPAARRGVADHQHRWDLARGGRRQRRDPDERGRRPEAGGAPPCAPPIR